MVANDEVVCFWVAVILFIVVVADPISPINDVMGLKHPPPLPLPCDPPPEGEELGVVVGALQQEFPRCCDCVAQRRPRYHIARRLLLTLC